mgnify:CR=1 FL=1
MAVGGFVAQDPATRLVGVDGAPFAPAGQRTRDGLFGRAQAPEPDLWLLFAPIKGDRIDTVAEKATELGVGGIALEMNLGYWPGGCLPRDLLAVSRHLDRWSLLGMPLIVYLTMPSSGAPDPQAQGDAQVVARDGGDPATPAMNQDLARHLVPLLLTKPALHAVVWNQWSDGEPLTAGRPVIVDIFPGEVGGGYHADMTRTFCMGPAPEPLARLHAETHEAYRAASAALAPGRPCRAFQDVACDVLERHGHATRRTDEATQSGYVHNLGHGVGLSVHDPPLLGGAPTNTVPLEPGMVVTVEPGLYYPERGMGCRIEDLFHVRADGTVENLTPFPCDLEIEPRG